MLPSLSCSWTRVRVTQYEIKGSHQIVAWRLKTGKQDSASSLTPDVYHFRILKATSIKLHSINPQIMPYPTRHQVYKIFKNLENPDGGIEEFFKSFSPNVEYTVPGHGRFAGYYPRKEDYYNATWAKFRQVLREPGFKFLIVDGEDGVITGQDGWAVVIMQTVDTVTKSGVVYDQHYSWHCKFNEEKLVVKCRAYLDLGYLEDVLGTEMKLQGID